MSAPDEVTFEADDEIIAVAPIDSVSLTLSDLPMMISQALEMEPIEDTYDVLNIIFNVSNRLFTHGAAKMEEKRKDFFNRVAPIIMDYMVAYDVMAQEKAKFIRTFVDKVVSTSVDMVEDVILVDLDSDGKIGKTAGDDNDQISQKKSCFPFFR